MSIHHHRATHQWRSSRKKKGLRGRGDFTHSLAGEKRWTTVGGPKCERREGSALLFECTTKREKTVEKDQTKRAGCPQRTLCSPEDRQRGLRMSGCDTRRRLCSARHGRIGRGEKNRRIITVKRLNEPPAHDEIVLTQKDRATRRPEDARR